MCVKNLHVYKKLILTIYQSYFRDEEIDSLIKCHNSLLTINSKQLK